jgi:hypothetical protein
MHRSSSSANAGGVKGVSKMFKNQTAITPNKDKDVKQP